MTNHTSPQLLEIKRATLTQTGEFTGYASTWDGEPDLQNDTVARGAFSPALTLHRKNNTMPAMLWNHDSSEPIGRWLSFEEDSTGLLATGKLTLDTKRGREAHALLKDNAISLSIGFSLARNGSRMKGDVREITNISRLHEISLVAVPANHNARIVEVKASPRAFEKALRERLGLSQREAKRVVSGGYSRLVRDERSDLEALCERVEELQLIVQRMRH